MNTLAEVIIIALAAYRVWRLLALDYITEKPREWVTSKGSNMLSYWLLCPHCSGTWFAVLLGLLYYIGWVPLAFLAVLAVAALVGVVGDITLHSIKVEAEMDAAVGDQS